MPFSSCTIDPTRITQVIVNLLSNASKYSPTGKGIRIKSIILSREHVKDVYY